MLIHYIYHNPTSKEIIPKRQLILACFDREGSMIKSIEPYSSTKDTLRKEVCSRFIKPTTQVYLTKVRLLTRSLTCDTIVQTNVQRERMSNIVKAYKAHNPNIP